MKIIFIAGPYYSCGDSEKIKKNIYNAEQYQIALANHGIGFFCPHNHTKNFEQKSKASEDFYKEMDMLFLKRVSDAVLAIPGWEKSQGAREEIRWAKENNLKIFLPTSPDSLEDVVNWSKL